MTKSIRTQIIEAFSAANEEFISGQALADLIGCSRTAIWKHIEELRKDGIEIEAVRRKGYRLVGLSDRLNESEILYQLETKTMGRRVLHYDSIESTQIIAHKVAAEGAEEGTLVIAEEQTGGKGRLSRPWHSLKSKGVWMSLIIRPQLPLAKAPQFTLVTAIAVTRAIEEVTELNVEIKWPNDILHRGKKLAGILTELQGESDQINYLVIGIGINVNQELSDFPDDLTNKASSLFIESNQKISRNGVVQSFLKHFEKYYNLYNEKGFAPLKIIWENYAESIGKDVIAQTPRGMIKGKALGITDEGILLIKDKEGITHRIYSADIETLPWS